MSAQALTKQLRGRWHGAYGMIRCPCHHDRTPSLMIRDDLGKTDGVDVHCYAGCDWRDIKRALQLERARPARSAQVSPRPEPDTRNRDLARAIWRECRPAAGSPIEAYLRGRGITLPPPPSLRFHPALKHTPTGLDLPAMVAAVQDASRAVVGIHRTFLKYDGRAKAGVSQPKMSLGPIAGGAVRLGPADEALALTEGIEDALALMQMTGTTCWALLGTSGFRTFAPPPGVKSIILAPDNDEPGQAVLEPTAERLRALGIAVKVARPAPGCDWCDALEQYEERAAMAEFDCGLPRQDAEDAAFAAALRMGTDGRET